MIGVKIDAESRYAVNTHVTVFCEVCSPAWIVGRTGITNDCSSAYVAPRWRARTNVAW